MSIYVQIHGSRKYDMVYDYIETLGFQRRYLDLESASGRAHGPFLATNCSYVTSVHIIRWVI